MANKYYVRYFNKVDSEPKIDYVGESLKAAEYAAKKIANNKSFDAVILLKEVSAVLPDSEIRDESRFVTDVKTQWQEKGMY